MIAARYVSYYSARAIQKPASDPASSAEFQAWFDDHQQYRWGQAQKLTDRLAEGALTPEEWFDAFDAFLLEGHANAWWIGRELAGDVSDFGDTDLLIGRGFKDAELSYLRNFMNDIAQGRYTGDDKKLKTSQLNNRAALYIGKFRGTVNEAFVNGSADDDEFYWMLGGTEKHCDECPEYAEIFSPEIKARLFTTPGAGDTPCLGNCLCYLDRVATDGTRTTGVKAVPLGNDDE